MYLHFYKDSDRVFHDMLESSMEKCGISISTVAWLKSHALVLFIRSTNIY